MSEQKFYMDINEEEQKERAILVGADFDNMEDFDLYMDELKQLARACNMEVVCIITQKLDMPNKATLIGPGKVEEVKESAVMLDADIVIFAQTLSPSQLRNLQNQLHIAIMDRTSLILEIFSKRARTREAKIQVEVARLQYTLPRLVGLHEALSRQGGGSGSMSNKGAGEKKLELDRRYLENRLAQLRRELKDLEENRQVQRKRRDKNGVFRVALVGYTNAGKSTLMNAFIDYGKKGDDYDRDEKKVFEKDMLFATLDTTVRRIEPEGKIPFLLTDTVGFVSHLPHALVEAFHSTLEETKDADVLLHVVDASDVNHEEQIDITRDVLKDLESGSIPAIYVYNKADILFAPEELPKRVGNKIYMSASRQIGMEELLQMIQEVFMKNYIACKLLIPYKDGASYSHLKQNAQITEEEYVEDGIRIKGKLLKEDYMRMQEYVVE